MTGSAKGSPAAPVPAPDRRLAILIGQAVGDALGAGTEFQTPERIRQRYGDFLTAGDARYVQGVNHGFKPGEFTDDTHMLLSILGAYWDRQLRGDNLLEAALRRFQAWRAARPPDIGNTTQAALLASRQHGLAGGFQSWEASGYSSAGNGALMRAAASAIAGQRGEALRTDAVELAMVTHPDPRSLGACWLLVAALEAMSRDAEPAAAWRAALDELPKARLHRIVERHFGKHRATLIQERMPEVTDVLRRAVEAGLTGAWRSQRGYVIDTLEAVVAVSLAPSYLDGILPVVARGDDSDTVAAIAGGVLGARGLLPPPDLLAGLRCDFRWPSWPPRLVAAWPALSAFVPPLPAEPGSDPAEDDAEAAETYRLLPTLPPFEFDEVEDGLLAGRAPLFRRDVRALRAAGVTHVLDLREEHEWNGPGRRGAAAVAELGRLGLARLAVSVTDMGAPRSRAFDDAVAWIEAARHLGGTVYVHCRAGQERTAAVVAAWLARQRQCSVAEAIERLRARRPSFAPLPHQVRAAHAWVVQQPPR